MNKSSYTNLQKLSYNFICQDMLMVNSNVKDCPILKKLKSLSMRKSSEKSNQSSKYSQLTQITFTDEKDKKFLDESLSDISSFILEDNNSSINSSFDSCDNENIESIIIIEEQ